RRLQHRAGVHRARHGPARRRDLAVLLRHGGVPLVDAAGQAAPRRVPRRPAAGRVRLGRHALRHDGRAGHEAAGLRGQPAGPQHRHGRDRLRAGRHPRRERPPDRGLLAGRLRLHQRRLHREGGRVAAQGHGRLGARGQDRPARLPHAGQQAIRHAVRAALMRRPVRRRGPRPALFPVVAFLAAACAAGDPGAEPEPAVGPRTVEVDAGAYAAVLHVSAARGSDEAGDGSAPRPRASIGHALARITDAGPANRYAVFVAEGVYAGETLAMKEHVDLFGGFEPDGWRRDIHAHPTVLDGEGERRIAVGADHATLDGFVLRRGAVRGKGGALLLDGVSTTVSNNVFAGNTTAAPQPWAPPVWHETANDGGAIACLNGCSAV